MVDAELAVNDVLVPLWNRFLQLVFAPFSNEQMLWTAIPLFVATLFIILYFARHRDEELGWNTAFGNTMIFLYAAIGLIREMYYKDNGGSLEGLLQNEFYLTLTIALAGSSIFLMLITYFHLMPKRMAFFLFSAPPLNAVLYVFMAIVYANVAPDVITVGATMIFLLTILACGWLIKLLLSPFSIETEKKETRVKEPFEEDDVGELVEDELKKAATARHRESSTAGKRRAAPPRA